MGKEQHPRAMRGLVGYDSPGDDRLARCGRGHEVWISHSFLAD